MFVQKLLSQHIGIDLKSSQYFLIACDEQLQSFDLVEKKEECTIHCPNLEIIQKKYNFLNFGGCVKVAKKSEKERIFGIIDYTNKVVYGKSGQKYLTIFRPLSFPSVKGFLIATKNKLSQNVYAYASTTGKKQNGFDLIQCEETLGNVNQRTTDILAPFHSFDVYPKKWKSAITSSISDVVDFTQKNVFSIDGESTVDVDDAIHLESFLK